MIEENIGKNTAIKRIVFIIAFTIVLSSIIIFLQYGRLPKAYVISLIVGVILMSLFGAIGVIYRNNELIKKLRNSHGKLQFVIGVILFVISLILFFLEEEVKSQDFYTFLLGVILIISGIYQMKKKNIVK